MDKWSWRDHLASWIHRLGYKLSPGEDHEVLIRDADGNEIFSIGSQGFVCAGPAEPYTLHCRHYADEDDMVGEVFDL